MSKLNPLGLLVNYGDSDEDIDEGSPISAKNNDYATRKTPATYAGYESSYQASNTPAGIHPAPIPHCPWSACYDENSGFTYYWNQQTNAVTWEAPPEYMLALKLAQQQLHTSGSTEVSAEEWQLYQQALAEKQNSQNKIIAKTAVNATKKPEKGPKEKNSKSLKKRAASDDEEEKIELITSYHNSDSESNDESEKTPPVKPPLPKPPNKLPKHPQKKQKTKPQVEFGPPLPPNQNYSVPIGPELPTGLLNESKLKSPEKKVDFTVKQDAPQTSKSIDDDAQDENCLLQKLKDKAKLLEKLGGELPSDLQKIIKDDTRSNNASPRGEPNAAELDIDDLLQEIEKTELPKVKSKDMNEKQKSNKSITSSPKSGDRTPPLEELHALFPNTNGPSTSLFPSAANIDESKLDIKPETAIVEKEKKENVYLMNLDVPIENVGRKKLRISNSVLPERRKEKFELPAYTTKYSQFIEGFSNERTGLGFTKEEESGSSPKNMINYGNGLTFTKGETLNEEKKDEDLDDLTDLVEAKLKFLNQLQPCVLSPLQEMLIQMQTLVSAFRAGALSGAYWRRWARGAEGALARHEAAAAPPGWLCVFQRSEGRYCYRRESDGFVQYEYPAVANTDMDICTTPPHPSTEPKQEVNPPPPPPSPPHCWRSTPPPPGTDPVPPEAPPPPRIEPKKEIGDELQSFYNDIAELEKTSGSTEPNSPEPPPPPEISDKSKDKENKVVKKKSKMKVSSSLGMKHKSVSTLVAKWQQVADEINSD